MKSNTIWNGDEFYQGEILLGWIQPMQIKSGTRWTAVYKCQSQGIGHDQIEARHLVEMAHEVRGAHESQG